MGFIGTDGNVGGGSKKFWNFSNKERDSFSLELEGDISELVLLPKTVFGSNEIDRFKNGNPKQNLRVFVQQEDGTDIIWEFYIGVGDRRKSGGEDMRSNALIALTDALLKVEPDASDVDKCLGMHIKVSTKEPPEGFSYSAHTRRPFTVVLDNSNPIEHRGCTVKGDWEKEEAEKPPTKKEPVSDDPNDFRNRIPGVQFEEVASVYDDDIPF